jgi:oxygen-independent coproporphyrinogen-3 oxidase
MNAYDVPAPRYTSYPTVPAWSEEFTASDYARALHRGRAALSLYVHVPFCEERCLFCGCNVVIAKTQERADEYLGHVEEELRLVGAALGERRTAAAMHWGGGTPTFLDESRLERLFASIARRFDLGADLSVEIDPRVTTVSQLETLRRLGFTRVSMGVQDFDPVVQSAIGREQPIEQTETLLAAARRLRFASVNLDLIYGLPHQTPASWARTLDQVVELDPDRIAVFAMAYVPDLKPHQRRLPVLPEGEDKLRLFEQAVARLTGAGYRFIGMDHFAKPGDELAIASGEKRLRRNFQGYTTDTLEVIGVGASAISDVGGAFAQNHTALAKYYGAVASGRLATTKGIVRTTDDDRRGRIIADIMCNFEVALGAGWGQELSRLRRFEADGLVRIHGDRLVVTEEGKRFVRNVAMTFDAHLKPEAVHARAI